MYTKFNLRTSHHLTCNLSQLFPRLLIMVASTTAVHSYVHPGPMGFKRHTYVNSKMRWIMLNMCFLVEWSYSWYYWHIYSRNLFNNSCLDSGWSSQSNFFITKHHFVNIIFFSHDNIVFHSCIKNQIMSIFCGQFDSEYTLTKEKQIAQEIPSILIPNICGVICMTYSAYAK